MRTRLAAALVAIGAVAAGCGGGPGTGTAITVFAASSLSEPFEALTAEFTARNEGTEIVLNLGGSQQLVTQLAHGAEADVIATADVITMGRLVDTGELDGTPRVFARNRLQVVVREGNPMHIRGLADLSRADLVVVMASPEVPAGAYSRDVLARAGVNVEPRSLEQNVRQVLSKVALGEADAGIVYVTDVLSASGVEGIAIPDEDNVRTAYPIGVLRSASDMPSARAFVDFVLSPAGQDILSEFGFLPP